MSNLPHLTGVFRWVLQTTWQASVLAGLILLAQGLLRKRLSAGWRYGLWLLLVARLLMPATPQSALSIFNLLRSKPENSFATGRYYSPSSIDPYFTVNSFNGRPSPNISTTPVEMPPPSIPPGVTIIPERKVDWFGVAFWGWVAGVCFFGARLVWTNGRFRSRIGGHQPISDKAVTRLFDECRAALKIKQPVRLIETEEVESPGVYGLWRKWLLLPDGIFERFSMEELRCIVLHELAHIKRGDLGVNWVVSVSQVAHWFNPVLWLAFSRMRADRELATDALALAHVAASENVAYGETILKVVENLVRGPAQAGLVGIAESKAGLKSRLRAITQVGASRPWKWAAAVVAVTVAGIGLTDARQPGATTDPKSTLSKETKSPVVSAKPTMLPTEISGMVVGPDGHPAVAAQVAVIKPTSEIHLSGSPHLFNPDFPHLMGGVMPEDRDWNYCTTDIHGNFYLNDLTGALFLAASGEKGFAMIATNEFSAKMTVKLEPWGRIEGTVWLYDKVVTNETVWAGRRDEGTAWPRNPGFETKTDDHGRFGFDYLPSGDFIVRGLGFQERSTVQSGDTAVVKIGGSGRPVIGKFKVKNPSVVIEWGRGRGIYQLYTFAPKPPAGFKSQDEIKAWSKRPEIARFFERYQLRPLQVAEDGSFRIDQVDPGSYNLSAEIHNPGEAPWSPNFIATYEGEFEIPASKAGAHEPFDLGVIEISLKTNQPAAHAVALPESRRPEAGAGPTSLEVTIPKQGPMYLGKEPVTLEKLTNALIRAVRANSNTTLFIRAYKDTPFDHVARVMDAAQSASVKTVSASVVGVSEGP